MYLLKNGKVVNKGKIQELDILIHNQRIVKISSDISDDKAEVIDLNGQLVLPGMIDDQVHFREPGLTHKANILTESRAAVAGGITSFMEMPNTVPNTLTQELLEDKYEIARKTSLANYSFFMGASNDNLEEVLKTDASKVCGVKVFMGSSTGNMLVDNEQTLERLFSNCPMLIATHCEDEATVRQNIENYMNLYGEDIPIIFHPNIRSREACYISSSKAASLAKKHDARLHILHISTKEELDLFDNTIPLAQKRLTAEACIHHLWFSDEQYEQKGTHIKWNPAVKSAEDRDAILQAVLDDRIDVIATDHAPHTLEEKSNKYLKAPSGGPLVQHAIPALLDLYHQGKITLERIVQKTAHSVADCFDIKDRGYIREGYYADLVVINPNKPWTVTPENILYNCGWSPFEDHKFNSSIEHTFVSGHLAYSKGKFDDSKLGERMIFDRG